VVGLALLPRLRLGVEEEVLALAAGLVPRLDPALDPAVDLFGVRVLLLPGAADPGHLLGLTAELDRLAEQSVRRPVVLVEVAVEHPDVVPLGGPDPGHRDHPKHRVGPLPPPLP